MQTVLLVVQSLIALALIAVILIQRTAQDGGGLMGGGSTMGGLFTARGSANLLTRTTGVLATIFILNSLLLGYLASSQHQNTSVLDQIAPVAPLSLSPPQKPSDEKDASPSKESPQSPTTPEVPVAQ